MNNTDYGILATICLVMLVPIGVQNSYAQELTYNEKIEFAMKLEQITGHMISALDNIVEKDWQLAKMHLVHPMGEHHQITSILHKDAACTTKLELALNMLQYTNPQIDKGAAEQKFAYVFEIIEDCKQDVIGDERNNLSFNRELVERLLKQSQKEYEYSQILAGKSKLMEIQDSKGIAIRAHMLISDNNILGKVGNDKISAKFNELFTVYETNPTLTELSHADNAILDEIDRCIAENSKSFGGQFGEITNNISNKPSLILKTTEYSNNNVLVELEGMNFHVNSKLTIEYYSPNSDNHKTLKVHTGNNGEFLSAIEFVQDASTEPYLFSITIDDIQLYEVLSLS